MSAYRSRPSGGAQIAILVAVSIAVLVGLLAVCSQAVAWK